MKGDRDASVGRPPDPAPARPSSGFDWRRNGESGAGDGSGAGWSRRGGRALSGRGAPEPDAGPDGDASFGRGRRGSGGFSGGGGWFTRPPRVGRDTTGGAGLGNMARATRARLAATRTLVTWATAFLTPAPPGVDTGSGVPGRDGLGSGAGAGALVSALPSRGGGPGTGRGSRSVGGGLGT